MRAALRCLGVHEQQLIPLPCEVERVHEAQATRARQTAGGDVDGKELSELLLLHLARQRISRWIWIRKWHSRAIEERRKIEGTRTLGIRLWSQHIYEGELRQRTYVDSIVVRA